MLFLCVVCVLYVCDAMCVRVATCATNTSCTRTHNTATFFRDSDQCKPLTIVVFQTLLTGVAVFESTTGAGTVCACVGSFA